MRKALVVAVVSLFAVACLTVTAFAAGGALNAGEKSFMKNAASSGMMEVELGKVAQQKGSAQAVKDFGKKMETDHTANGEELKSVAQQDNLQLPAQMERKHKSKVEKLSKLSGAEFDKKYMHEMVMDHEKDIAAYKKASGKVKNQALKDYIDKTIPTLQQHLDLAKQTAQQVGVKVK